MSFQNLILMLIDIIKQKSRFTGDYETTVLALKMVAYQQLSISKTIDKEYRLSHALAKSMDWFTEAMNYLDTHETPSIQCAFSRDVSLRELDLATIIDLCHELMFFKDRLAGQDLHFLYKHLAGNRAESPSYFQSPSLDALLVALKEEAEKYSAFGQGCYITGEAAQHLAYDMSKHLSFCDVVYESTVVGCVPHLLSLLSGFGFGFKIMDSDPVKKPKFITSTELLKFDYGFGYLPLETPLDKLSQSRLKKDVYGRFEVVCKDYDVALMQHLLRQVKHKAFLVVMDRFLFAGFNKNMRQWLIKGGYLEAIVSLPRLIWGSKNIATSLLVLNPNPNASSGSSLSSILNKDLGAKPNNNPDNKQNNKLENKLGSNLSQYGDTNSKAAIFKHDGSCAEQTVRFINLNQNRFITKQGRLAHLNDIQQCAHLIMSKKGSADAACIGLSSIKAADYNLLPSTYLNQDVKVERWLTENDSRLVKLDSLVTFLRGLPQDYPKGAGAVYEVTALDIPSDYGVMLAPSKVIADVADPMQFYHLCLRENDIVLTTKSNCGRVGLVDNAFTRYEYPCLASKSCIVLRLKDDKNAKINAQALFLYLRSDIGQALIMQRVTGSKVDNLPLGKLKDLPVPLPQKSVLDHAIGHMVEEKKLQHYEQKAKEALLQAAEEVWQ